MIRLGTRASALALAQAQLVADRLPSGRLVPITTSGDRGSRDDKSRFVKEIEEALLAGSVDLAVHSAKDVPGELPQGLSIVGVPSRADALDALCGAASLESLEEGAVVGTASVRRRAQLLALRPDLEVRELRGNVDTRLRRLAEGDFDAIVLARAGLVRLGRGNEGTALAELVPAPGQGCLVLEARSDDEAVREAAAALTDEDALCALTAERALVSALDATCNTPIGAWARREREATAERDAPREDPPRERELRDDLAGGGIAERAAPPHRLRGPPGRLALDPRRARRRRRRSGRSWPRRCRASRGGRGAGAPCRGGAGGRRGVAFRPCPGAWCIWWGPGRAIPV